MLDSLWDRMLTELERRLPASALDSWLRPCRLAALDGDDLRIAAPNKYTRDWLMQNHLAALETAAREIFGGNPRVGIIIDSALPATPRAHPATPLDPQSLPSGLSTRYTFDSFVVGNSNQFAQAACQAVAELPSKAYNPLFIYGGVGLGKDTSAPRRRPPDRPPTPPSVAPISHRAFHGPLINAIPTTAPPSPRQYRTIDLSS